MYKRQGQNTALVVHQQADDPALVGFHIAVSSLFHDDEMCIRDSLYDELYKNSDRITHVLTAHEQGAAHAADGYARATGRTRCV